MNRKTFGSTALVLALLLAVTTLGFSPAALASGDERTGRLSVSGVGAVEVAPDQATVRIRLSHLRDAAAEAQAANAAALQALREVLAALGITEDDLKTQGVSLREEWEYVTTERVFKGYRAEHSIAVTVNDLAQVGPVVDAVSEVSGLTIDSVQFGLRDRREAERLALQQAYAHAESRARILAQMAGITLGAPASIVDQTSVQPSLPLRSLEASAAKLVAFDAATEVFAGTITVEARVHLEFVYDR
jgi:uncharacterized protein YggE